MKINSTLIHIITILVVMYLNPILIHTQEITPEIINLSHTGNDSAVYIIESYHYLDTYLSGYEFLPNKPDWIIFDSITERVIDPWYYIEYATLVVKVSPYEALNSRSTKILVTWKDPYLDIYYYDSVLLVQDSMPQINIIPDFQSVIYEGGTTDTFSITNNVVDWEIGSTLPNWVSVNDSSHTDTNRYIIFDVDENLYNAPRESEIIIEEDGNSSVSDTLTIQQDAAPPYLIVQPDFQSIPHQTGTTDPFNITNNLTTDWKISGTLPGWLSVNDSSNTDDYIIFEVEENIGDTYRDTIVIIQDENNSDIADTLTIFQGAASQPFLMVSPEVQSIGYEGGETDPFHVIYFNIDGWERGSDLPNWITEPPSRTIDSVVYIVEENTDPTYRDTIIVFREIQNPDVADTVTIFQTAVEPFIAISPEIQSISSAGGETDTFNIIPFNIEGWEVANPSDLPYGITLSIEDTVNNILTFNVPLNQSASLQEASITVQEVNNPEVSNDLTIYQGAQSKPSILVTPEIQTIDYKQQTTDHFNIVNFNITDWVVDFATVPDWIIQTNEDHVADTVTFSVSQNDGGEMRIATITIHDTIDPTIEDELKIYQGSLAESEILATPESLSLDYQAHPLDDEDEVKVDIIHFNISDWKIDPNSLPEPDQWITVANTNHTAGDEDGQNDYVKFNITQNTGETLRQHTVIVQDSLDPEVKDEITIYQGALSQSVVIAIPESLTLDYLAHPLDDEDEVKVDIIHFNISDWKIDPNSLPEPDQWITVANTNHIAGDEDGQNDYVKFNITQNTGDILRQHTIIVQDSLDPEVKDEITIYQGALSQSVVIAVPESLIVNSGGHEPSDPVEIIHFNISDWKIDPSSLPEPDQWITVANTNHTAGDEDGQDDYVKFNITQNTGDTLRQHTIIVQDSLNPDVKDEITIIQGAPETKRLIATPDEFYVSHKGKSNLQAYITKINVSGWKVDEITKPDWFTNTHGNGSPILTFDITETPHNSSRVDSLKLFPISDPEVVEYIKVKQFGKAEPYFIVQPYEQFKSHDTGWLKYPFIVNTFNFNDTLWTYTDLADSNWISVERRDDSLFVKITEENKGLKERFAIITVTSEHATPVIDTMRVTQFTDEFPYIFVIPGSYSSIPAVGDNFEIEVNSNSMWNITKELNPTWFSVYPESGENNDTCTVTVTENIDTIDYFVRRSWIKFKTEQDSVTFDLVQFAPDLSISGKIVDSKNGTLIEAVKVVIGSDTVDAKLNDGSFTGKVHYGWKGYIAPLIDKYYFDPLFHQVDEPLFMDKPYDESDSTRIEFQAIEIDPKIRFSDTIVNNCFNNKIVESKDIGDPFVTIEGYSGATEYEWAVNPHYYKAFSDSTKKEPDFLTQNATDDTLVFTLTLTNLDPEVSASFEMIIRPSPDARPIESDWWTVCKKQAGVIYLADTSTSLAPKEHFTWSIDPDTAGTFDTLSNTNIAVVNWGKVSGEYLLNLKTHNEFGCTADFTKVVTISPSESPLPIDVHWKQPDNVLYFEEIDIRSDSCQWGCIEMITEIKIGNEDVDTIIVLETIFSGKNDWYCRLPEGYEFNTQKYNYFVIRYSDTRDCWTRSFYNPPLYIAELSEGNILVFPNPTDGLLNVRFQNISRPQTGNLQLYDISGNLIYKEKINGLKNNSTITIEDIWNKEDGIYLLRIHTDDYYFISKIVVR